VGAQHPRIHLITDARTVAEAEPIRQTESWNCLGVSIGLALPVGCCQVQEVVPPPAGTQPTAAECRGCAPAGGREISASSWRRGHDHEPVEQRRWPAGRSFLGMGRVTGATSTHIRIGPGTGPGPGPGRFARASIPLHLHAFCFPTRQRSASPTRARETRIVFSKLPPRPSPPATLRSPSPAS
jgi:hypothetical protein